MKQLLLLTGLILGIANTLHAQCSDAVPQHAFVYCDTALTLRDLESTAIWMANDTAHVYFRGNSNSIYFTGNVTNKIHLEGRYNVVYMTAPNPHAEVIGNSNALYLNNTANLKLSGDSNLIYLDDVTIELTGNNNIIYANNLNYIINTGVNNMVYPNTVCSNVTISTAIAPPNNCNQTTGIIEDAVSIDVYPNPATDNVTFNLQNAGEVKTITIYDIAGKTVEVIANINADKATIDTSKLSTGMYVFSITLANGKTQRGKLLVG